MKALVAISILAALSAAGGLSLAEVPANLRDENVVAWCIVPFDAKRRGPVERTAMLVDLGLRRCAYDWRQEHVPTFEQETLEYRKHGIELFAFWSVHEDAFKLFEKYDLHPQIWLTLGGGQGASDEEKAVFLAQSMEGLAKRTAGLGCKLGLYNHGGWGGEPKNLVVVCRKLRERGHDHAGIVYNFHHGHGHIADWAESFALMQPYLLCLNINGMVLNGDAEGRKILPLGQGDQELEMLRVVMESGYDGPIAILDHRPETDSAETLRENLEGLDWLRKELENPGSGGARPSSRAAAE